MRQTKWFGVVKGHDCEIHYHPDKANVVTDTLSRKQLPNRPSQVSPIDDDVVSLDLICFQKQGKF